jgi:hypothetical protein
MCKTLTLALALDSAFVDRADIVQYIDLPPPEAIYVILRSCLLELIAKGVVASVVRYIVCVSKVLVSKTSIGSSVAGRSTVF